MTIAKKLKKTIRARARKTGESYTSARRQVLLARAKRAGNGVTRSAAVSTPASTKASAVKTTSRNAGLGLSEASVLKKTGKGYDHWFAVLDAFGAQKGHSAFADHLYSAHGIPGWHAQGIAVAYERAHGLRAANQACSGTFQVSVSRALAAPVAEVAAALSVPARRRQWLRGADDGLSRALDEAFTGPKPRTITMKKDGYARMRYKWDGGTVEIRITAKPGGATIVADNSEMNDGALVETRRAQWKVALDALKVYLLV